MKQLEFYQKKLDELKAQANFRTIKSLEQAGKFVIFEGKKLLNLSSNDYLGISANDDIKDDFLSKYRGKIQNPSARLLSGGNKIFLELENLIKEKLNKEACLLFNSGYHANLGIYSALLSSDDVVFIDKLNHASIIDGIKLSGAKLIPFNHADYSDLEEKLKKYRNKFKKSVISSESLFSMDGDFADVKKLAELKEKYNSILIIDEAHSFGVYGGGAGFSAEAGIIGEIDLIMGTFGKAIGSFGAFAAGNKVLINYLINFSRSFIFSTALPEISVAFSMFVLDNYIFKNTVLQEKLFETVNYAHEKINALGQSYIMPVIRGENLAAEKTSSELIQNGFFALPIRFPTVKKGTARIRMSINPLIAKNEIDTLAEILS